MKGNRIIIEDLTAIDLRKILIDSNLYNKKVRVLEKDGEIKITCRK